MGRRPIGADTIMGFILELAGDCHRLDSPITAIANRSELNPVTIKKYLLQLDDEMRVQLVYGGHRRSQIVYLLVLENEVDSQKNRNQSTDSSVSNRRMVVLKKSVLPIVPVTSIVNTETRVPTIVLLVDYDNTVSTARENAFNISFARLKEFVRTLGQIFFADVFLSPVAAQRPENISGLWHAGFQVVTCPMGTKDKDAVDSKMMWRARQYLECTTADTIVIVSRDEDFRELVDFAADRHRKVEFLDVNRERLNVEGEDVSPKLIESRILSRFWIDVDCLTDGRKSEDEQGVEFLRAIIKVFAERKDPHPISFEPLKTYIWSQIQSNWGRIFKDYDLKAAMTALVNGGVIKRNVGSNLVYYTLERTHQATRRTLGIS